MRLIVKVKELRYDGKTYLRNEEFEAPEKDARVLKLIGKAGDPDQKSPLRVAEPRPSGSTQTRDLLSEGTQPAPSVRGRGRGRYSRSDMRSED